MFMLRFGRFFRSVSAMIGAAGFVAFVSVGCGGTGSSASGVAGDAAEVVGGPVVVFPIDGTTDDATDAVGKRSYDTVQMGRIAEGDVVEGRFRVVNASDKPLVIVQVITGCGCTTADYDPAPVPAGDTIVMTWRFDSRGRFGQQFKSIEIISAERHCATVYLAGEVVL